MNLTSLEKVWIVAEIGVNHEGDRAVAEDLIRKAADAGADAVKFQTYEAANYISSVQPERLERVKKFQLSRDDFRRLAQVSADAGVTFFSTPLHPDDVDFLDDIVPIFKVSSGDLTYLDLIAHVAAKNKPVILSTGLGTPDEIRAAVDTVLAIRPNAISRGELILLHCSAAYPTPDDEANLGNIAWLGETFGVPVGYSDHTLGTKACELAVACGAVSLEKHFTYRKEDQTFHDHAISADPDDMRQLVEAVRRVELFIGRRHRERGNAEAKNIENMRRSVAAACDIPAGIAIQKEWLTCLRPAWGLPPEALNGIVGMKLNRAISAGDLIGKDDLSS